MLSKKSEVLNANRKVENKTRLPLHKGAFGEKPKADLAIVLKGAFGGRRRLDVSTGSSIK